MYVLISSFRIVPITGVFQHGWLTISTTLSIRLHVSQSEYATYNVFVFLLYFHHIKAKLSFSAAYGELQVNYALILFVVRILIITLAYHKHRLLICLFPL